LLIQKDLCLAFCLLLVRKQSYDFVYFSVQSLVHLSHATVLFS
jgi:hypothetical protein